MLKIEFLTSTKILETVIKSLESELKDRSAEIEAMRESKRVFSDRGNSD